ncbi:MAG: GHKL domain-containing protein [Ruminiclostridium sp.]|nr:GHKL domain-containing protein [Ruminiclostridium sp.]
MNGKKLQTEYDALLEKYNSVLSEKAAAEYELSELKAAAESISRQDEEVRRLHESIRSIKHDMRNHLMVIASYLNGSDTAAAKAYTSEILDKLNSVHSYVETGNSLMNHILNEKLNLARGKGIAVKAEIENLSFARMESIDFSALLSNILDNAVDASEKETSPELTVQIARRRDYETILVKNKIARSVLSENPGLASSKPEKASHGMGVPQIRSICEKYGGMCDFYEEDGYFCVSSFIPV